MIKLSNVNKYYNKNKSNEIHVINNTYIEFGDSGLVCLLGASGSGKTTLLNVIGGLDKASGEFIYDDIRLKNYKMRKVDKLRRQNMGYIFQNYYLFPDMSVYDNLKFALNLAHIYDKNEIEARINYCLEAVNMLNYKRRKASALSGGQQQRVAIARALVKKSKVIIADEPTGNLDSNNTVEIMNIIKKISETCLVILVTHERNLATFYADRIVELKDGKIISDEINQSVDSLDHKDSRIVYLKDLNNKQEQMNNLNLNLYYEEELNEKVDIRVVYKGGSLIVDVKSPLKVKYITPSSELSLVDDHARAIQKTDASNFKFDNSFFTKSKGKKDILNQLWTDFKSAFLKFYNVKFRFKMLYLGFILIGILAAYTIAFFSDVEFLDEKAYIIQDKNILTLVNNTNEDIDINKLLSQPEISGVSLGDKYTGSYSNIYIGNTFQTSNLTYNLYGNSLISTNEYKNNNLTIGRLPQTFFEVAIDKWICDDIVSNAKYQVGQVSCLDLIGKKFEYSIYGSINQFVITGITNRNAKVVTLTPAAYIDYYVNHLTNSNSFIDVRLVDSNPNIKLLEGRLPSNEGEILIPYNKNFEVKLGDEIESFGIKELYKKFKVVGIYDNSLKKDFRETLYVGFEEGNSFYNLQAKVQTELDIFTFDKEATTAYLEEHGYSVKDANEVSKKEHLNRQNASTIASISVIVIFTTGILLFIFFMMRSRMINRIYDIGVYRALGASRVNVLRLFFMEIFVLTTFTTILGFVGGSYLINSINSTLKDFGTILYYPWYNFLLGLIGIYLLHLLFGLLPVLQLLRKTPSQILTKYDI